MVETNVGIKNGVPSEVTRYENYIGPRFCTVEEAESYIRVNGPLLDSRAIKAKLAARRRKHKRTTICDTLNVLFWKVPSVTGTKVASQDAEWWVAELADKDIHVRWNKEKNEFEEGGEHG